MIHPIKKSKTIQHPTGKPVDVRDAFQGFVDGRVVGYITGNTCAMLTKLWEMPPHGPGCKCAGKKRQYGFVYLNRPCSGPTFVNPSVGAAITQAQTYQPRAEDRKFYLCHNVRELLDLFDSRDSK